VPGLSIEVTHSPDECLVVLAGEMDMASQTAVYRDVVAALNLCRDNAPTVVVDLAGVTFLDSSGLGALVEIRRQALARKQSVTLRSPNERVTRVLQLARVDVLFEMDYGSD
jgi:anti-sigma B factor antagonist